MGISPVTGCGFSYSEEELETGLSNYITAIVFDDSGKMRFKAMFTEIATTEFQNGEIEQFLPDSKMYEDWRVGEAIAETYLSHHRGCFFPWPDSRDERKRGSSLPGADLVGFQSNGKDDVFVFGEAKTSSEKMYPPGIMYGRTGLKKQIEDLKNDVEIQKDLIMYLGHRAVNSNWQERFKRAYLNFDKCRTNVRIFGFLVRDVEPNVNDIRTRVSKLAVDQHPDMVIELLVLYLPQNSINQLSKKVVSYRKGGVE